MASARSARPVLRVPATHSQVPGKQPPLQEVPTAAAAGPRIAGRASACPPAAEHAPSASQPHSPHGALCRSQTMSQARRGCLGAGLTRAPPPAPWPACLYGTDFLARVAQAVPRCMILPPPCPPPPNNLHDQSTNTRGRLSPLLPHPQVIYCSLAPTQPLMRSLPLPPWLSISAPTDKSHTAFSLHSRHAPHMELSSVIKLTLFSHIQDTKAIQ